MARTTTAERREGIERWRGQVAAREAKRDADDETLMRINKSTKAQVQRRADWSEWSAQHERQRIANETAEVQKRIGTPIYPREMAVKLAADTARIGVPDWRLLRDEHRGDVARILREQPELHQRDMRQRDQLLRAVFDHLPAHLRPVLSDLRVLWDVLIVAHEATAYLIGVETGRVLERAHVDARGRLRHGTTPARNRLALAEGGAR
jgi:hypothetical protein